uniref:Uncharacterized protein n=1 Tax=Panagrolaimus sp. JU765 TaxID=591449 RepID=A0AC34R2P8_9BILA
MCFDVDSTVGRHSLKNDDRILFIFYFLNSLLQLGIGNSRNNIILFCSGGCGKGAKFSEKETKEICIKKNATMEAKKEDGTLVTTFPVNISISTISLNAKEAVSFDLETNNLTGHDGTENVGIFGASLLKFKSQSIGFDESNFPPTPTAIKPTTTSTTIPTTATTTDSIESSTVIEKRPIFASAKKNLNYTFSMMLLTFFIQI